MLIRAGSEMRPPV